VARESCQSFARSIMDSAINENVDNFFIIMCSFMKSYNTFHLIYLEFTFIWISHFVKASMSFSSVHYHGSKFYLL
jgi:hypothetical protein